jgi:hypothetical protein
MSGKATFIRQIEGWQGDARLYKVDPPISYSTWEEHEHVDHQTEYVIVSAVNALFSGPETYIFPASLEGKMLSWSELDGSQRGTLCHECVLEDAGYTITGE